MSSNPLAATYSPVPQLDLAAQYAAIGGEVREAIERVLSSQQFILGREGAALEEEIARLCGVAHGFGTGSGTDALLLALSSCQLRVPRRKAALYLLPVQRLRAPG